MTSHSEKLFDAEPWRLRAGEFNPNQQMLLETLFAQANGYVGSRGSFEEPLSDSIVSCEGVYLNGVYQQEPIIHAETAYGFATHNQKMVQVPNGKYIRLTLDGECLSACGAAASGERCLDFKSGVLTRTQHWITSSGKRIALKSRRFVSLANKQLMAIEYQLTAENFSGSIQLDSSLDASYRFAANKDDPRAGQLSLEDSLNLVEKHQSPQINALLHHVRGTDFLVGSLTLDVVPPGAERLETTDYQGKYLSHSYMLSLKQGETTTFYKWIAYDHSREVKKDLLPQLQHVVESAALAGFSGALDAHQQYFDAFWDTADVEIEGDVKLQQGIRFNLFHLYQSVSKNAHANIGAKGLTGHGYDGHYFWDTEIYVIPALCFSQPELAKKLIEFRIGTLSKARERARQMSHETGALYPWRTIGGEECSAYFPAGTAQYHINAAIAYALKCYFNATDNRQLLWQGGAEMLFETARLWLHLGHFNKRRAGKFCIDAVTGPDEYTAVVNNNFYTNAMAQMHLRFAVEISQALMKEDVQLYQQLATRINLTAEEISLWTQAAEQMYLPFDETLGIHLQDDSFLDKATWDFANTPAEKYPLLLHFHPLVIYRHQVLKQADVVLAMYLLDEEFGADQKMRNLSYYEPITTHDSTLSTCIHSIESAETGDHLKAYQYFENTVRMDLDNCHANSEYGVHIACMAGSWSSIVHGFAGFRARKAGLYFKPWLPKQWQGYCFNLSYRQNKLKVRVSVDGVFYQLLEGPGLTLTHVDELFVLNPAMPKQTISWAHTSKNTQNHCEGIES